LAVAILSFLYIAGCGGGTKAGAPLFAGRITLTPTANSSLQLGNTLTFFSTVQTASGTTLNTAVTYTSSDTSILNLSSNGVACAGHWDAAFTSCTPGAVGVVTVTASALGSSSIPTYVFVHPPIDNITVTGVLLNGLPVQEPCLTRTQSMTVEAHAFSQGVDVTSSVGPFSWSANNTSVVNLVPLVDSAYNFPTNRATATASNPGITQVFASASGVTSTMFQQPSYINGSGATSPVLDFFSTCPIQSIALEVGFAGSGQTSFATSKGTAQTVVATLTDVMGNSSLPNTNGGIVLSKIPLLWTSSQPGILPASTSCVQSCAVSPASPGAATITASCSPPSCNIGYPVVPASLATSAQLTACTQFFQAQYPQFGGCQELIPAPVYASVAVSGLITGTPGSASVLAASTDCAQEPPANCTAAAYYLSTAKASPGGENPLPTAPNSFLFDLAGDKVYMGSDFGAEVINPANFGTNNNPFTSLGTLTGSALAVSNNGLVAAFADTVHTPNQVYIYNSTTTSAPTATALTIPSATAAAFSPDGLKTFILAGTSGTSLYVYSTLQALQGPITLSGASNAVAFSPNSAFAFVAEAANGAASANVSAFANCVNPAVSTIQPALSVPLPATPLLMKVLPNSHLDGKDSYGYAIQDGIHVLVLDATGINIVTFTVANPATGTTCPQVLASASNDPARAAQRIELGQGTLQPGTYANFFASADGSQIYFVNSASSTVTVYNFIVGSVIGGIELLNNATPINADISVDTATIVISGSDGMLHEVSTSTGGADLVQLPFPNLPNYLNPFCTFTPSSGPCKLNVTLAKP
jgi:hypothetical protein